MLCRSDSVDGKRALASLLNSPREEEGPREVLARGAERKLQGLRIVSGAGFLKAASWYLFAIFGSPAGLLKDPALGAFTAVVAVVVVALAATGLSKAFHVRTRLELTVLYISMLWLHLDAAGYIIGWVDETRFDILATVFGITGTLGALAHLSVFIRRFDSQILRIIIWLVTFIMLMALFQFVVMMLFVCFDGLHHGYRVI